MVNWGASEDFMNLRVGDIFTPINIARIVKDFV